MDNKNAEGKKTSGTHESYWITDVEPLKYSSLTENIETDVVIVGGGISGMSVAYNLLKAGKKVVVAEDGFIGSGETGRTTAHLSNALDDRYYEIERIFGEDGAKLAAESHTAAIDFIEAAVREENITCDFERVNGYLFLHPTDKEENIEKELEAAKKAGIQVNKADKVPHFKMNQKAPCIEFANQAQFHPLKYLRGLSQAIIAKGGKIFTETHVGKIDETGVETDGGYKISAAHVVVATNSPVNNKYVMHLKQYPYRTFVIAATVKKGSVPHLLWWDTGDHEMNADIAPYHYVRVQPYNEEFDLLISGGEDHPTGLPEAHDATESSGYAKLEGWTRARFDFEEIVYRWSGQVLEPMDAMGYIGKNPMDKDNIYIVTGDSGNGMTHGTIAGLLLTDLITGKENPWEKLYDPSRTNFLKSGKVFLKEFVGGLFQYFKNAPEDTNIKLSEIGTLEARVVKMGKEKYGVYRDENNALHVVSATCTHAGCTIKWNGDETSWDCPCHGSRFSMEGKVLNGPAKEDLVYYKEEAE